MNTAITNNDASNRTYGASTVKRSRRTRDEIAELDTAIVAAVSLEAPVTLRGVYYRVVSAGAVPKTENGYRAVARRLLELRREGRIAYSDITDGTRWVRAPRSYDDMGEALLDAAVNYRRSLWSRSTTRVMVFTEKDAITGVIEPTTMKWDVPLGVMRGYVSESFAWKVAESLDAWYSNIIVQLGDHDPSGVGAWEDFASKVRGFTGHAHDIEFVRLAVTPEQITTFNLPTRPTKNTDTRARGWEGGSVEVDAIPAPELRRLLDDFLGGFHDREELDRLDALEQVERESVFAYAKSFYKNRGAMFGGES